MLRYNLTTHSSILAWRIPKDRGVWRATGHGAAESDTTEVTKQHRDDTARLVTAIPEGLHFSVFQLSRTIIICHFPQVLTLAALSWIFSDLFFFFKKNVLLLLHYKSK